MGAHRAAWIKSKGEIPEGLVVCHKCDNGLCINIDHLFLGTLKENMQDCIDKGRFKLINLYTDQKGKNNAHASPNYEERDAKVMLLRSQGKSYSEIKKELNIKSNGHLRNIIKRNT